MSEKTKRSRSIYTVNEKTTEVTPQTPIIKQIKQEATSPSQERKVKDYTPEWRKIPSVGSFGDFDRGVDNAKLVYPEPIPGNVYYSNSNTDFLKPGKFDS